MLKEPIGYVHNAEIGVTVPPLDDNKTIPENFLPAIAITDTFVVDDQAQMLALNAQRGDVAIRADLKQDQVFILRTAPATSLANWQVLPTPTIPVLAVNGKTGIIVLTSADIGSVGLTGDDLIQGLKAFAGILRAQGPVDEALKGFSRIDLGVQNSTARFILESKNQSGTGTTIWEIDNQDGILRLFVPGSTKWTLDQNGNLAITGALAVGSAAMAATTRTNLGINSATWTNLTLQNSWTNAAGTTARYTKLTNGWVVVEGLLGKLLRPTAGEAIATLPSGFRPTASALKYPLIDGSTSRPYVEVSTAGAILYNNASTIPATVSNLSLAGIAFYGG